MEAENEQPARTKTLNIYLTTIEAHNNKPVTARGIAFPPLRIVPKHRKQPQEQHYQQQHHQHTQQLALQQPQSAETTNTQATPSDNAQNAQIAANTTDNSALIAMMQQQTLITQSLQATITELQAELKRMRETANTTSQAAHSNL